MPRNPNASISDREQHSIASEACDLYSNLDSIPLGPSEVVPTSTYIERGHRWMEKEEACSLRHAMDDMGLKEGSLDCNSRRSDQRLFEAALSEASELVWQHQHGIPPSMDGPYRYRSHLRKNSYAHARTASVGNYSGKNMAPSAVRGMNRSVSGSSTSSTADPPVTTQAYPDTTADEGLPSNQNMVMGKGNSSKFPPNLRLQGPRTAFPRAGARCGYPKRNISGEVENSFTTDQIWEEPSGLGTAYQTAASGTLPVLTTKNDNPLGRREFVQKQPNPCLSTIHLHLNPPSRSRDPQYVTNPTLPNCIEGEGDGKSLGIEIRSDDIRQATSMRLNNRSPKLPTPTAVSDNPSRPIVSFDALWSPSEKSDGVEKGGKGGASSRPPKTDAPSGAQTGAGPPTILVPTVALNGNTQSPEELAAETRQVPSSIPSIMVGGVEAADHPSSVSLEPGSQGVRPLPNPLPTKIGRRPRKQFSYQGNSTTICHECGLSLQGRFVALAGSNERFHPQCLACYICGTSLEALEISPEPDISREERLQRIQRREAGEVLQEVPGKTMAEDGDDRRRFYCHLDWHELFAPKCKHCKTSILGEHIVALGEHWHYGHFFCAECGDPFDHGMTHIEKDGYAWCIGCQTKRTERRAPKCKKCKTAVVGEYVQALGGEWHDACFRCTNCGGPFNDGQIFPKEETGGPVTVFCTECRMSELKQWTA